MAMSKIDKLNKKLEEVEASIDANADGDPSYLGDLMSEREKIEEDINQEMFNQF